MRTIIVDDEKHSRDALKMMLERYCPGVSVQAVCNNGTEALQAIKELQPQLIFLDVEMPGMDGFQVLEACEDRSFAVIFITAYDQYALQAIHHSALDYLLKPIDVQELRDAVEKAGSEENKDTDNRYVITFQLFTNRFSCFYNVVIDGRGGYPKKFAYFFIRPFFYLNQLENLATFRWQSIYGILEKLKMFFTAKCFFDMAVFITRPID